MCSGVDGIIQVWGTSFSVWSPKIERHSKIRRIKGKNVMFLEIEIPGDPKKVLLFDQA